jgi:hypothetical protein
MVGALDQCTWHVTALIACPAFTLTPAACPSGRQFLAFRKCCMFASRGLTVPYCCCGPRTRCSFAAAPGSVPLYQRISTDYAPAAGVMLGADKGLSFSGPSGTPPARSSRYRRMSADQQLALMQAAGVPVPEEVVLDLVGAV